MITFFVPGIPQPGGSKRGFFIPKMKRVVIVDANEKKVKPWRQSVVDAARAVHVHPPLREPIRLCVRFVMPRPQHHFRTGKHKGELKPDAPNWHTKKPDATKLLRSLEDALTGIVWADDAQICEQMVEKVYGDNPGADVTIRYAHKA